uniref:uncharacterized protein LOC122595308 n=1 Tax=Erigeron canadensis TaxID=72917 RepID=UPI001CB94C7B|nr:uncharacterized protein LOC122595308 [Erigeron canadensis]
MWYDKWCMEGPLYEFNNRRALYNARVEEDISVDKMIDNGFRKWPVGWLDQFPNLRNIVVPTIYNGKEDQVMWYTTNNQKVEFSTRQAWNDLRHEWPSVEWKNVIWFNQFNPRHAFILWLAIQVKLLTQDKMAMWMTEAEFKCGLCKCSDICKDLCQLWDQLQDIDSLQDVVSILARKRESNKLDVVVNKLLVAAAVYHIWQERNARIFMNQERSSEKICQAIRVGVTYKLMAIKVRKTRNVKKIAAMWNLNWSKNSLKAI